MLHTLWRSGYPAGAPCWTFLWRLGVPIAIRLEVVHETKKNVMKLIDSNVEGLALETKGILSFMDDVQRLIDDRFRRILGKKFNLDVCPMTITITPREL